ncbi:MULTISPECIES: GntR family transcriptional regulator [Micrococcaceae]|uniref:Transcriptional regulator, GntR family n=1 Tax=Arthrobacter rhombi TaxID=71253 RepID=A0A1R4GKJ7_9MICC|nr:MULTISPECIES: GntR family transcriptional regulator [Micrococcaceae]PCC24908.1 GntR family transcriptional regulator [Glutamicibacter sp. BW78]SJM68615.1 Transcriptional regulator, GntR family [Arthrobacter rhombi]
MVIEDALPVRGNSYVEIAYEHLRRLILSGELAPGNRVTVQPLTESLGLSPTPIRTALAALERQGLLVAQEHRGYFVPKLGRKDILEIYEIREVIDSVASRRVAELESRSDIVAALEELLVQQRHAVSEGDISAYRDLDLAFHKAIWQSSGNHRLLSLAENLLGQVRIGNNVSSRVPGRVQIALEEHAAIIKALKAGSPQDAENATRAHVREASRALADYLARLEDRPSA